MKPIPVPVSQPHRNPSNGAVDSASDLKEVIANVQVHMCVHVSMMIISLTYSYTHCHYQANTCEYVGIDTELNDEQSERLWGAVQVCVCIIVSYVCIISLILCLMYTYDLVITSTLMCAYCLQTNKSVKRLDFYDGFVLKETNKWLSMAMQVGTVWCCGV